MAKPRRERDARLFRALAAAEPTPFWLDNKARPEARPVLSGDISCDLAVVGGGFSGLWTALLAKKRDPSSEVVLVDGSRIAWAASGRNGGFCAASLTHGEANGRERFGDEHELLSRMGAANLDAIEELVFSESIDCGFERTGELDVATEQYQVDDLRHHGGEFLDKEAVQAEVASPTYLAGNWDRRGVAILDPARLAWGLAAAAETKGVRLFEHTRVESLETEGGGLVLRTPAGRVRAARVALGTSAFPPLLGRLRYHVVPVYDYVLVTEPLSGPQLASLGWANRQGIGDSGNQFHYYRLTEDNRVLFGGYDAVYHYGRHLRASYDQRQATFLKLADHFYETFPQLEGIGFTHRWGGAIDTCTRFCAFFGTGYGSRVAYSLGFTGLGVGASRFGAEVMLDLLQGEVTERTSLKMVRSRPLPFPPEPLAYLAIQATRLSLARADKNQGKRNSWLRLLDRIGVGYDS
jgi:glycine/D-amino acid oxidase-like deaminating enzyme